MPRRTIEDFHEIAITEPERIARYMEALGGLEPSNAPARRPADQTLNDEARVDTPHWPGL